MRCSTCSEIVKPVVAVDIDGTLADFHAHFIWFAEMYTGRDLYRAYGYDGNYCDADGTPFESNFRAWFNDTCGIGTDEFREIKLAFRQGGMKRSLRIFAGARALCWAIRDRGAELWLTTTRPYLSLDGVFKDTLFWLDRYEIAYDGIIFQEDKYAVLAERIDPGRVVAVLDDLPEMYDAAGSIFGPQVPILRTIRYNRGVRRPLMCDLDAAADIILPRIDEWKGIHGAAAA